MAYLPFDATDIPTESPREALPAGDYPVVITDSLVKTSKAGGNYLELTLQVLDGPYANRLTWDRITLDNANPTAAEIGKRQLSQVCHAVGVLQVQDSAQLHGIPLIARLKYKVDEKYGPKNEVGGYRPMNAPATAPAFQAQASAVAPAPFNPAATPAPAATPWSQPVAPAAPMPPPAAATSARPPWAAKAA